MHSFVYLAVNKKGFSLPELIRMDAPEFSDAVIKAGIGVEAYLFGNYGKRKITVLQKLFGHIDY